MRKEYIISVEVDKDGHEYDMKREEELVRCPDCVLKEDKELAGGWQYWCWLFKMPVVEDFYCGFGKKREEND